MCEIREGEALISIVLRVNFFEKRDKNDDQKFKFSQKRER